MHPPPGARAVLALDTASPVVSVAVAAPEGVLGRRTEPIGRSSARLIAMIDEVLGEARLRLGELAGVVVLAGPGSFTGLRVGMATAMGFHQTLGLPATAVPTLPVLAAWVEIEENCEEAGWGQEKEAGSRVIAVVDVLRGEWAAQEFEQGGDEPRPVGEAERIAETELAARAGGAQPAVVVGHNVARLAALGLRAVEAGPLAPVSALAAARRPPEWDAGSLTRPLYFRPPAATPPRPKALT